MNVYLSKFRPDYGVYMTALCELETNVNVLTIMRLFWSVEQVVTSTVIQNRMRLCYYEFILHRLKCKGNPHMDMTDFVAFRTDTFK